MFSMMITDDYLKVNYINFLVLQSGHSKILLVHTYPAAGSATVRNINNLSEY